MGATAVRAHTLGVSTGTPKALEPELGRYNAAAFDPIDYAIAEAGRQGLKLIIPLTDNWQYYHGSRFDYLRWLGLSTRRRRGLVLHRSRRARGLPALRQAAAAAPQPLHRAALRRTTRRSWPGSWATSSTG